MFKIGDRVNFTPLHKADETLPYKNGKVIEIQKVNGIDHDFLTVYFDQYGDYVAPSIDFKPIIKKSSKKPKLTFAKFIEPCKDRYTDNELWLMKWIWDIRGSGKL